MESCIYEGRVLHQRSSPTSHKFEFPMFMMYLDLAELPEVFRGRWLWSHRRPALARFDRRDHLGDPEVPLDRAVRDLVETNCGSRPSGPIRLLTHLRYLGLAFNPVSFFYCFSESGDALEAIVAEVTNTPWKERHCYVLRPESGEFEQPVQRFVDRKDFHVSPFMDMDVTYHWSVATPGRTLRIGIANRGSDGKGFFSALLEMKRVEIDGGSLARVLARYPWMTAQVIAGIYWQAWRLHRKGVPYHPHPGARVPGLDRSAMA